MFSYRLFVVDPDGLEVVGQLIAQHALHDIQIVVQQQRRGFALGLGADVLPQLVEELHVAGDLFLGAALGGGAGDESACRSGTASLQDALQAQTFLVARDLARDAHVLERRHIHHVAARQGDVRGDARALLPQRLLGDLDDDLLPFLEQIADGRLAEDGGGDSRRVRRCALARGPG